MLNVDSLEGTVLNARLKDVCSTDHTTKARYQLKKDVNFVRHRDLYDDDLFDLLKKTLRDHNYFFDYVIN